MNISKIIFICFFGCFFSCKKDHNPSEAHAHQITITSDWIIKSDEALDWNSKGIELSKSGDYIQARKMFLKANSIEPNNPVILNNLGLNRSSVKEFDQAIEFFKKAYIKSDSTYHLAGVNLSLTYYRKGDYNNGIKTSNHIIRNATDKSLLAMARVHRAFNFAGNKECDKAKADLKYFRINFSSIPNAEEHIEDIEYKIKNCVQQRI